MQAWHVKAAVDGVKALLPFQQTLRAVKRRLTPYQTDAENDIGLLSDAVCQIDTLTRAGVEIAHARVIEIGTGWNPIVPLLFRMCGAKSVVTVDRERLLDRPLFLSSVQYIKQNLAAVLARHTVKLDAQPERIWTRGSFDEMLQQSCIEYLAPADFTHLASRSADIIVSRDVLEHIPEGVLRDLTAHAHRILRTDGVMCHCVDMSDHWEHKDKSISRVNFLQFDGLAWQLAGINPQNFQNRLRRFEYVQMFQAAGFQVLSASGEAHSASLQALQSLPVCARYRDVPHEELAVLSTIILARRV